MTQPIRLQFELVLTADAVDQIAKLLTPTKSPEQLRREASRHALYGGDPPEDESLTIGTNEIAKLLNMSARTVFKLHKDGQMPKALRLGQMVRWGRAEIKAWVDEGCPPAAEWEWPKKS